MCQERERVMNHNGEEQERPYIGGMLLCLDLVVEKERSDFGCLIGWMGTRICLANFVNQSGF